MIVFIRNKQGAFLLIHAVHHWTAENLNSLISLRSAGLLSVELLSSRLHMSIYLKAFSQKPSGESLLISE